jgi:hypothetical protein
VTSEPALDRIAVVVHPTRATETALSALRRWTGGRGIELEQFKTRQGSSVCSMAIGSPVTAAGGRAFVCTPLAMPAGAKLIVDVSPGDAGVDVESDGHRTSAATASSSRSRTPRRRS